MRKTFSRRHKQLWLWLAENPRCTEKDHVMWTEMEPYDIPIKHCFACEEALFRKVQVAHEPYVSRCRYCPIHIFIPGESTACLGGLYDNYVHEENLTIRSSLAFKIANLPWRQILTQQNAELLTQVSKDKETISHTPEGEKLKTNTLKTKNVTIRTGKHLFYCTCGCNVFHKPDNENANLYQCNSCGTQYYGESE